MRRSDSIVPTARRMHHSPSSMGDPEHGGSVAELAVILPLALLVLVGTLDMARAWAASSAVENAAHAGAQYGAQSTGHARDRVGIEAAAYADLADSIAGGTEAEVDVTRRCECANGTATDCEAGACSAARVYVNVRVETSYDTMFDYPGLPSELPIVREARMRAR